MTNDAGGVLSLVAWVGTSLLLGAACQRVTGRLTLGVSAAIVAFGVLHVIANEPMHPQVVIAPIFAAITLVIASNPEGGRRAGIAVGALLGAMILSKVNIGALALVALVVAAFLTVGPLYERRALRLAAIGAFLALPTLLMNRDLDTAWVRDFIALMLFSTIAVLIAARAVRPEHGERAPGQMEMARGALIGLLGAIFAILLVVLIAGTPLSALVEDTVTGTWAIARFLTVPFESPAAAPDWGIMAIAAAAVAIRLPARRSRRAGIWPGLGRVAAGLTIWLTISQAAAPISLNPAGNRLALPLVLIWVAMLAPAGVEREGQGRRFNRAFLCFFALAEALQVYPVAGSQVGLASLTLVAVGALCVNDGMRQIRAWSATQEVEIAWRTGVIASMVGVAVAAIFAFNVVLRPLADNAVLYSEEQSLGLHGAGLFHLSATQGEELRQLTDLVKEQGCTGLVGYPNFDSLYLWTGIEPPDPVPPGAWVILFDRGQQRRTVESIAETAHPCAIRSDEMAEEWLEGGPPREGALVEYIVNGELEPAGHVGERYELLVPPGAAGR